MEELFSCRNCVHNPGQSLSVGRGAGYCVKHDSILLNPERTTCKYLHRKDLPSFVVDEGVREHAAEFATAPGIADLYTHERVPRGYYSERYAWDSRSFDPLLHSIAQYRKTSPSWVFVQAMSGGLDGRRTLAHAGLVRRYMARCGTWRSSYRIVLALVQELAIEPQFMPEDMNAETSGKAKELITEGKWDVFFTRLGGVQEYGFHAGIEPLMWATDQLNGGLSSLDWGALQGELRVKIPHWTNTILEHAKAEGEYFPSPAATDSELVEPENE